MSLSYLWIGICWMIGWVLLYRSSRWQRRDKMASPSSPQVSVIIPARNEATQIGGVLDSLQTETQWVKEVIVVDDNSEDGTATIARERGARVIRLDRLPRRWMGKPWACWNGAVQATGRILLFLDADVRIQPGGVGRMLDWMERQSVACMTIQPYHQMRRTVEQLSAFFNLLVVGASGWGLPDRFFRGLRGAFGPCLLCTKQAYQAVGGHRAVKGELLENAQLVKRFQAKKLAVIGSTGRGVVHFRMYPDGWGQMVKGWGKTFAAGAGSTPARLLWANVAWLAGAVSLLMEMTSLFTGGTKSVPFLLAYAGYAGQWLWAFRKVGNFQWWTAVLFPIPLLFFLMVFTWSLWNHWTGGQMAWKGRMIGGRGRDDT